MKYNFDNIEKALEKHFSLHDVSEMMCLINAYREYEHKFVKGDYSEDDFTDFLKQYKNDGTPIELLNDTYDLLDNLEMNPDKEGFSGWTVHFALLERLYNYLKGEPVAQDN